MAPPNPYLRRPLSPGNEANLRAFERSLKAKRRSDRTIASYLEAARILAGFLDDVDLDQATRPDIERYIVDELDRTSPGSAATRFRSLGPLYSWMVAEDIVAKSPMAGMSAPTQQTRPVPVVSDDDLRKLVKACAGRAIVDKRDEAIIRLLIDTGARAGEVAGLRVSDLDMKRDEVAFRGKGDKVRVLPFSPKTGVALDRYLRLRARSRQAAAEWLWVGGRGVALTDSGIRQMLDRRAATAGIRHLHPHQLRHSAAHFASANGMGDSDMMRIFGWSSRDMVTRYGSSAADERARAAQRRLSPGDRI